MKRMTATSLVAALLVGCGQTEIVSPSQTEPADSTYGGIYETPVTLTDGKYTGEPFVAGGASRPTVALLQQPRWQIDLDGDSQSETIVLLVESSGGSGSFVYLAVVGLSDAAESTESLVIPAYLLGDRIDVALLALGKDGRLKVVVQPRASAEAASVGQVREFEVADDGLVPLTQVSGLLTYGHEVRQLRHCSDDGLLWVSERAPGVVSEHFDSPRPDPYRSRFVSLLGQITAAPDAEFAAAFEQQVVVSALAHLENEGPGCARQFGNAAFRAFGEEPFWNLAVFADRLEYSEIGADPLIYPLDSDEAGFLWSESGGVLSALVKTEDAEQRQTVLLELRSQPCLDTMAGNLYAWQAQLTVGAKSVAGCALSATAVNQ